MSDKENPNFIEVVHGRMRINVPLSIFEGSTWRIREEEIPSFRETLATRYPWLSRHAIDVVIEETQQAMYDRIQDQMSATNKARNMMGEGRYDLAADLLRRHMERNGEDPASLYALGEALCRMGRRDEGFELLRKARNFGTSSRR